VAQSRKIWSRKCGRPVLLGVWLLVHAAGASARADSPDPPGGTSNAPPDAAPPDAARLYDQGRRYFNVGEYDRAIEKLKAAYVVAPLPELLYDLGQAFRLKGDCAEALSLYRRYLTTNPPPPAPRAARTAARIADMEACVAAAPPAPAPPPAPTVAAPPAIGWHPSPDTLVTAAGHPEAQPNPPPLGPQRRAAWWTAAAAGAMAAVSGYYAWDAHAAANEVSSAFVPGRMWSDADEAARRRGIFAERMAIGTGAAAVLAAGVAAWLLWR
jgi:tetratricopeptide (TPR) repeat protein